MLGRGASGVVYDAEQESPRRPVALKVLSASASSEEGVLRFRREADVLGRLDHPGIAKVHEAGTFDDGGELRPWFAMERVEGSALTERAAALELEGRLDLLAEVCDAVHHAHQKGVIHRDLKPANVLVDAAGHARVLDFGLARAGDTHEPSTRTGELLGTVAYMSPEQVAGDTAAVDVRSDVYALGVLGYELVTGRLPVEVGGLPLSALIERVLREVPPRASALRRGLDRDVDLILATALHKDPDRRYPTAGSMARDLRRFREKLPIVARDPSTFYQLRMIARRHRLPVAAAAAVLVVLVASAIVSTRQYVLAEERRAEAEERAEVLAVTQEYYDGFFRRPSPFADGSQVTMLEVLESSAVGVEDAFPGRPDLAGHLFQRLGTTYGKLGFAERSEELLTLAKERLSEVGWSDEAQRLELEYELARARLGRNEHREGLAALERLRVESEGVDGLQRGFAAVLDLSSVEALAGLGRLEDAEEFVRSAKARALELGADGRKLLARAIAYEADYHRLRGELEEALRCDREVVAILEELYGEGSFLALGSRKSLAISLLRLGRFDEARPMMEEVVAGLGRVLPEGHVDLAHAAMTLAEARGMQGETESAFDLFREAIDMLEGEPSPEPELLAEARGSAAAAAWILGRADEALELYELAIAELEDLGSTREALYSQLLGGYGLILFEEGRIGEASHFLELGIEAHRTATAVVPLEKLAIVFDVAAGIASMEGRTSDAVELRREAAELAVDRSGGRSAAAVDARSSLALDLLQNGQADDALALVEEVWADAASAEGVDALTRAKCRSIRGYCLAVTGQGDEGCAEIERAIADLEALGPDGTPALGGVRAMAAVCADR